MAGIVQQGGGAYVVFRLGPEEYGLAIDRVQSIIRFEQPTPVPRAPESVLGVINLRGKVIPVVDLRKRLGRDPLVPSGTARIVVVEGQGGMLGLAVDEANEVVGIQESAIMQTPDTILTAESAEMFAGVVEREGSLVILLDLDRAIPKTEYARVTEDGPEGESDV